MYLTICLVGFVLVGIQVYCKSEIIKCELTGGKKCSYVIQKFDFNCQTS